MTYIQLSYGDLILPALLVVMNGALSIALHLRLERHLAIAAVRMLVQLVLVGYVLTFLFATVSPLWTALAAIAMVLFAAREVIARQKRQLRGWWAYGLGASCTLLAAGTVTVFALLPVMRDALRSGFMPTINGMAAIGLVSLPGMMTGQILSGVEPIDAVKYQLLIMFLIAGGTGLGTLAAVIGGGYRLTDSRHRLRLDRLTSETGP